ncbi:MAG: hypothetical protein K0R34_2135 [Herbinix sp.]|nr:hypothetical protein [Herbinix sp.]
MSEELQELMDNNPEWYKDILLVDAKEFIRANINSASRSFVAIGYYLKYIRDNQMFTKDGYQNIWEFAQSEFGISKSSASRFININDRFSKDGNSPILLEQYKDFNSSKLSEMLTMTDEQIEQVTITTTVAEIREIKQPIKDEVVATSQQEPQKEIEPRIRNAIIRAYIDGFTDWKKNSIRMEFASSKRLEDRIDYLKSCVAFGNTYLTIEGEEKKLYLRKSSDEELELSDFNNSFIEFAPGITKFTFTYGEMAGIADGMLYGLKTEPESEEVKLIDDLDFTVRTYNCLKRAGVDTVDNLCELTEIEVEMIRNISRKCVDEIKLKLSEIGMKLKTDIPEIVNDIAGIVDNEPEIENDVDETEAMIEDGYYDKLAAYWCRREMTVELYELAKSQEDEDIDVFNRYFKERYVHECIAPSYNLSRYEISFVTDMDGISFNDAEKTRYSWQLLIDLVCQEAENETPASKPTNLHENDEGLKRLREIRRELKSGKRVTKSVETIPEYIGTVSEVAESVIEEPETITEQFETVEADIIQMVPETDEDEDEPEIVDPEYYTYQDVDTEIDKLMEYLEAFRKNNDTVPGRRKAKMRFDAICLLSKEMQKPPVIEEPEPIQPELPILKNNDQRKDWADNYRAWNEWYYDDHIDCHYYKYDFPNGDRLVVDEYRDRELYWKAGKHDEQHYHLLRKEKLAYGDRRTYEERYSHQTSSMTEIVDYLKDLQKK